MRKLKNVDLEFIKEEVIPAGMDGTEAEENESVEKHISKINIIKDGKIIKVIEPMLYNAEFVRGEKPEEEFATLSVNKPEVNKSHNNQQNKPSEVSGNSSHD